MNIEFFFLFIILESCWNICLRFSTIKNRLIGILNVNSVKWFQIKILIDCCANYKVQQFRCTADPVFYQAFLFSPPLIRIFKPTTRGTVKQDDEKIIEKIILYFPIFRFMKQNCILYTQQQNRCASSLFLAVQHTTQWQLWGVWSIKMKIRHNHWLVASMIILYFSLLFFSYLLERLTIFLLHAIFKYCFSDRLFSLLLLFLLYNMLNRNSRIIFFFFNILRSLHVRIKRQQKIKRQTQACLVNRWQSVEIFLKMPSLLLLWTSHWILSVVLNMLQSFVFFVWNNDCCGLLFTRLCPFEKIYWEISNDCCEILGFDLLGNL